MNNGYGALRKYKNAFVVQRIRLTLCRDKRYRSGLVVTLAGDNRTTKTTTTREEKEVGGMKRRRRGVRE